MESTKGGRVVVITGASSGIGRATAHAFAEVGDTVVLAARRAEMLHDVEGECRERGGTALAIPTDVKREGDVEELGRQVLERFGRIDVWFNNAGVGVFGRFEDIPSDVWRSVIDTNLFGYVHGAKVAMRTFYQQGHGVLIQNASIVGRISKPDGSAYATSKFAIRGFSEALRQEVLDWPNIHICTILPSVIDTPFFHHTANFSGQRVRAAPPVYPPEKIAKTVVQLVDRPRAEVIIGGAGKLAAAQKRLAPTIMTWLTGRALHRGFLATEASPDTVGAVFEPMNDSRRVHGGWAEDPKRRSLPLTALALLVALPVGVAALRRLRSAS